jgi:hypothetical protein
MLKFIIYIYIYLFKGAKGVEAADITGINGETVQGSEYALPRNSNVQSNRRNTQANRSNRSSNRPRAQNNYNNQSEYSDRRQPSYSKQTINRRPNNAGIINNSFRAPKYSKNNNYVNNNQFDGNQNYSQRSKPRAYNNNNNQGYDLINSQVSHNRPQVNSYGTNNRYNDNGYIANGFNVASRNGYQQQCNN